MVDSEGPFQRCMEEAQQASTEGRRDDALSWLDQALRLRPGDAEARNGRGELLWENSCCDDALHEFVAAIEASPDYYPAHLNRIELLIEEFGEYERCLELSDELLARGLESEDEAEVFYLKAKGLFYLDDLEGALFLVRRAIQVTGEAGVYRGFEGQILFELGHLEGARTALHRAYQLDRDSAHTLYHLALLEEHEGRYERAEEFFVGAERLQPDLYPRPFRVSEEDFHKAAEEAVFSLPEPFRRYIGSCPIVIEDLPDPSVYQTHGESPALLGLFLGTPSTEPGHSPTLGTAPKFAMECILLFKRNLEKVARTREELIEQVQITVKHEIGHYLGLDEEAVERLGLA
jgi:predicted Zn-dependent protease with MMP-like domain